MGTYIISFDLSLYYIYILCIQFYHNCEWIINERCCKLKFILYEKYYSELCRHIIYNIMNLHISLIYWYLPGFFKTKCKHLIILNPSVAIIYYVIYILVRHIFLIYGSDHPFSITSLLFTADTHKLYNAFYQLCLHSIYIKHKLTLVLPDCV